MSLVIREHVIVKERTPIWTILGYLIDYKNQDAYHFDGNLSPVAARVREHNVRETAAPEQVPAELVVLHSAHFDSDVEEPSIQITDSESIFWAAAGNWETRKSANWSSRAPLANANKHAEVEETGSSECSDKKGKSLSSQTTRAQRKLETLRHRTSDQLDHQRTQGKRNERVTQ